MARLRPTTPLGPPHIQRRCRQLEQLHALARVPHPRLRPQPPCRHRFPPDALGRGLPCLWREGKLGLDELQSHALARRTSLALLLDVLREATAPLPSAAAQEEHAREEEQEEEAERQGEA